MSILLGIVITLLYYLIGVIWYSREGQWDIRASWDSNDSYLDLNEALKHWAYLTLWPVFLFIRAFR